MDTPMEKPPYPYVEVPHIGLPHVGVQIYKCMYIYRYKSGSCPGSCTNQFFITPSAPTPRTSNTPVDLPSP